MVAVTIFRCSSAIILGLTFGAMTLLCGSRVLAGAVEKAACSELYKQGFVSLVSEDKLLYRGGDRKWRTVSPNDTLPHYVDQLVYFTRTLPGQEGAKSVLNWKFVYTILARPNRRSLVGLYNDRWTAVQLAKSSAACANVSVEGYDNFHLYSTSNICLRFHFHQQDPDTLATSELRRSFAFDDMIPRESTDLLSSLWSFVGSAKADTVENSTIHGTLVKSWIRNFVYEPQMTCVAVTPSFPNNARGLHLRIVNHGTNFLPESQDWQLKFLD
ncbi:hypothetical protein JQ557_33305 [Bradyrhizobium sp. U87765 SZCCT0131]|uniref:hypothetical protein n=1 Tax=unclassified Bradyrhizobium TaxID=2631580 RepID=UPI001BAA3AA0|nr:MULTISPECIES: hypothetical protein [unclassified Bradyrhizobium]MBR1222920.1 hypothetical protein [Bradyrhizobium sp. U87765 SZCCT0131]MBR1262656.1 hypothetical protein [Bradyrhizobium sp. U87765 SZCCT0134]MBR1308872.1 hypothetical protein [Bradyrhizobium sp. U87765 SZCCT0110]MBR1318438.1 hypothetical protein [Bradyrhizobium sp. U87765 SZCCT0109]MBR1352142.1 hypothetical protein [Bradyrhizobium sp. U87765 SZCCT0048]